MHASNKIAPEETIELEDFNSKKIDVETNKRNRNKILIGVSIIALVALLVGLGFLINSFTGKTNTTEATTHTSTSIAPGSNFCNILFFKNNSTL